MAAYWESDGVDDMVTVQGSYAGVPGNFTSFELDIMVLERETWHQIINFGGYIVNFQSDTLNVTANSNIELMWVNGNPVVSGTPFFPIGERVLFRGQTKSGVSTGPTGSFILSNTVSQFLRGRIYDVKMYQGTTLGLHYDPSTGTMLDQSGNGRHATVVGGVYGDDAPSSVPVPIEGSIGEASALSGSLSVRRGLSATVAAASEAQARAGVRRELAASIAESSGAEASITLRRGLSASVATASEAQAMAGVRRGLVGSVGARSELAAALTAEGSVSLVGSVASASEVSGRLGIRRGLSAEVSEASEAQAIAGVRRGLAGAVEASAQTIGRVSVLRGMSGAIRVQASAAASLGRRVALRAGAVVQSIVEGVLRLASTYITRASVVRARYHPLKNLRGQYVDTRQLRGSVNVSIHNAPIAVYRGDFIQIKVNVADTSDLPLNLTGMTAELVLLSERGQMEILTEEGTIVDATSGLVQFDLTGGDTARRIGTYPYRVRVCESADRCVTVATGTIVIQ